LGAGFFLNVVFFTQGQPEGLRELGAGGVGLLVR
jgi:hypothetical protein